MRRKKTDNRAIENICMKLTLFSKRCPNMMQLQAFGPKILKTAHLVVLNSPRKTFYSIRIEECDGEFRVVKVSGAVGKVWDKRTWAFSTLQEAERLFSRRIKEKTDPDRHSPRKYSIQYLSPASTNGGGE